MPSSKANGNTETNGISKSDKKLKTKSESKSKDEEKNVSYFGLFRYATALDKICIILGALFAAACGVSQPFVVFLFGKITGNIVDYVTVVNTPNATETQIQEAADTLQNQTDEFAILLGVVGVALLLFTYVGNTLFSYSALRQIFCIRKHYLSSMLNQDIGWYDVHQTGDFASTLTENLGKVEEGLGEKMAIFIFANSTFVAGIVIAFVLGWELTLICLVSFPLSILTMGSVAWVSGKFVKKELDAYSSASAIAEEVLGSIRTVIAFDGQQKERERYKEHLVYARNNNVKKSVYTGISNALLWFFVYSCYALSFWYGIGLIIRERELPADERVYTADKLIIIFTCIIMSCWFFGQGAPYFEKFSAAQTAGGKIFSIIDSSPIINTSKGKGKRLENVSGHVSLSNVHFNYPSRKDVKTLNGINITIKPGETVALVGSSGCGKSTIVQLIQRFYDPDFGEVILDGHNIKDMDLTWLRSQIGVVGQEPVLFATTIAENIKFGNKAASQFEIEKAARKANVHDFIVNLPQGYNTLIGERGAHLSGGQKQRIAIARALVREPKILLLDEATSALDTSSEAIVQAALDAASNECTTIIVAHRLSTIRNADRIIVLSDGKVIEEGTHDELIGLQGVYYNLVTTQETTSEKEIDGKTDLANNHNLVATSRESLETELESIGKTVIDDKQHQHKKDQIGVGKTMLLIMKENAPEWFQILIGSIGAVVYGCALPFYAIIFGGIVGILASEDTDFMRSESNRYSLYFMILGFVAAAAVFLQTHMLTLAGENLTMRIRGRLFETMMEQEMAWFDKKDNGVGALCTRLSNQAASVQGASGNCIGTILNSATTFFLAAGLGIYYHWQLALVTLCFSPFIFISIYFEQRMASSDSGKTQHLENAGKLAIEAIGNIRTVASLVCENTFFDLYVTHLQKHHETNKKKMHFRGIMFGFARSLMPFAYIGAFSYGVYLIIHTNLDYGVVFKVSEAVIVGTWGVGNAVAYSPNFYKGIASAVQVFNMFDRVPQIRDSKNASTRSWNKGDVEYSKVYFSYPTRHTLPVLRDFDLSVSHGSTVALVGPSGCGKSTIVQLLERFYTPDFGEITVDEESIQSMRLSTLRSQLGIVSQEPNLFDRTIAENIAYGANDRTVDMDEVIEAAKKANIHNFVASLPLGYNTRLGEKGTQLSGGQKQRVAIARALIRNPKVLLLDEATSALDNESEKIVQEALNNARKGRTCITIAHRLSTIQDADVICVVNSGKIAEMGRHSELLRKRGLYHTFYSLQNRQ